MAFGSKSIAPKTNYTDSNGGSGRDIFFPTASGPNGTKVKYTFRIIPDTDDRTEDEVLFREWKSDKIMVKGRPSLRSCIVAANNPIDTAMWEKIAEIDAREDLTKEAKSELKRPIFKTQTSKGFALNVYNCDTGTVQILKGSWEALKRVMKDTGEDAPDGVTDGTVMRPVNPKGGKTIYYKLIDAIQEGVTVTSKTQKNKRDQITDPSLFDIYFYAQGEGQLGKNYSITAGALADFDESVYDLPRWDVAGWVENKGIWPNEAILELLAGADYYDTAAKYEVQLFPKHLEMPTKVTETNSDDSGDDELFQD